MTATMKAQFLSTQLKRDGECLSALADRLAKGELPEEQIPQVLDVIRRDLHVLSRTAGRRPL